MKAKIEVDVAGPEALGLIRQTLEQMTGVGTYTLSFEDDYGYPWSHEGRGVAFEVPHRKMSAVVALESLAETFEEWAGNVDYNNRDKRELWTGRANGFREAAREVRRIKKDLR